MNTKEQWEEDIQKRVNDIAYSHPKSGKEATENRNKILEIIRETREQAYKDGYSAGLQNSVLQSGGAKPQPLTGKI